MHDSRVIDADVVRLSPDPRRIPVPSEGSKGESSVELLRHADSVVGVEVNCTCGNCIRLRFDYEPGA